MEQSFSETQGWKGQTDTINPCRSKNKIIEQIQQFNHIVFQ